MQFINQCIARKNGLIVGNPNSMSVGQEAIIINQQKK